jgi:hypothetical protein
MIDTADVDCTAKCIAERLKSTTCGRLKRVSKGRNRKTTTSL